MMTGCLNNIGLIREQKPDLELQKAYRSLSEKRIFVPRQKSVAVTSQVEAGRRINVQRNHRLIAVRKDILS